MSMVRYGKTTKRSTLLTNYFVKMEQDLLETEIIS